MKASQLSPRQSWSILIGAGVMLTLSMGMRQSMGLFQPHVIREVGLTPADFSLAIAIQNILWGLTQPFAGMVVDRLGARRVAMCGVLVYALGLVISVLATSPLMFTLGAGICMGLAMSCTGLNLALNVAARTVSPARRSVAMGLVSAVGSLGLSFASPLAQSLIASGGWQLAMVAFIGLTAVMLPAAWPSGGCLAK